MCPLLEDVDKTDELQKYFSHCYSGVSLQVA